MTRPADQQQRDHARDPSRSFIVQAPAGSGKTELLTQRFLGLLARSEHPEEIVAITFTRKAAAEMNHRLVQHLRRAHDDPDAQGLEPHQQTSHALALAVLKNSEKRKWQLLQQPGRLRIRTIDSLCSDLARQLPVLSRLGGGQAVSDDPQSLYREAATRTLAMLEKRGEDLHQDIARILTRYDNQYDRMVKLVSSMLERRDQWLGPLMNCRHGDGFDRSGLESALAVLVQDQLDLLSRMLPDSLWQRLPRLLNFNIEFQPQDEADLRALLTDCVNQADGRLRLDTSAEALPHWKTLANRLITANGDKFLSSYTIRHGFPAKSAPGTAEEKALREAMKQDMLELVDEMRDNQALLEQLHRVRQLPAPRYEDEAWESLQSLMRILLHSVMEWKLLLAETGQADFTEISQCAIDALGEEDQPSDLALRLDYRIQHLLVDEFQDTSHSQIRLLERLTNGWADGDGRTLFLVGDPMQSIYRFRKAEVSLFMQAFQGRLFDHLQLHPLRLSVNFRSTRPVVDWVNHTFAHVLPDEDDAVMGAVSYAASRTRPGISEDGQVVSTISVDRNDESEAQAIVNIVAETDPQQTIGILVRSRAHANTLISQLNHLKLQDERFRYQAVDMTPLADTVLVRDLVSLTLALLQPADRLAWLSVLRAPWIGLQLRDLEMLAGDDWTQLIEAGINNHAGALSDDAQARLARVRPVFTKAMSRRGRAPLRQRVERCWIELGGPACVNNPSELIDAGTYFDLLESTETRDLPVDRETLLEQLKNLYAEPDARSDGRLQIMTVHKAKGLQFDTVILPGLGNQVSGSDSKLLYWFELADRDQIVLSPMRNTEEKEIQKKQGDLISFISAMEKRRDTFESGRLLYVAATRAERQLFLFGHVTASQNGDPSPRNNAPLALLWNVLAAQFEAPKDSVQDTQEESDEKLPLLPQVYRRLPADWQPPKPPPPIDSPDIDDSTPVEYIEFRWAGEDARLAGELVHRLLQEAAETGMEHWQSSGGISTRRNWCQHRLKSEGVQDERIAQIVEDIEKAVNNSIDSERGRWIMDQHPEAACELPITALVEGKPRNMVLDRTFVFDDERWIIDYKTSQHRGGDIKGFLENEEARYREQLQRYRDAMRLSESRPIRTALYFPLLNAFREVIFD